MNPSEAPKPLPTSTFTQVHQHLYALTQLRRQMIELHARVEYLRLMMRLSALR